MGSEAPGLPPSLLAGFRGHWTNPAHGPPLTPSGSSPSGLQGLPSLSPAGSQLILPLAASSAAVGSGPPPEAEQAWPQSSGEEELQLQLALAMSKEEADQVAGWVGVGHSGGLTLVLPSRLHPSLLSS